MADHLEALLESLLWEGYALYPYTPGATKNATPTPFGIVYPPVYAATLASTFDHLELRCIVQAPPDAVLSAEVRFLEASGERHQGQARRVELPGAMAGALSGRAAVKAASVGALTVELSLETVPLPAGDEYEVVLRVRNRTLVSSGLDRAGALRRSLISTHPVLRVAGGRFVSALERPCASVNTFPVLAADGDDVMLGAAIVLPDYPRLAPESLGGLFDSTEIEEALLLHVRTLSDGERAEIERQDPAVRAMVARAQSATPEDIVSLHGRVQLRDPVTLEPPSEPPGLADPRAGDSVLDVGDRTFRRGAKVVIRPGPDADIQARMLDGRRATLERIYIDYDDRVHLAVTVDDDPGQELMRETGRYLYFFAPELEVVEP